LKVAKNPSKVLAANLFTNHNPIVTMLSSTGYAPDSAALAFYEHISVTNAPDVI
jgi:hypothetical protein